MAHLAFVLAALALLAGFFALARYEARRGTRILAPTRERLDRTAARAEFILTHVDFVAFAREEARRAMHRVWHDLAHVSLRAVRAVERLLTRLVKHLRVAHGVTAAPRESARPFVQTLSDFKDQLKSARPDAPDIQ